MPGPTMGPAGSRAGSWIPANWVSAFTKWNKEEFKAKKQKLNLKQHKKISGYLQLPSCHTRPSTSSPGNPQLKAIFSLQHLHPDGMHDMRGPVCKWWCNSSSVKLEASSALQYVPYVGMCRLQPLKLRLSWCCGRRWRHGCRGPTVGTSCRSPRQDQTGTQHRVRAVRRVSLDSVIYSLWRCIPVNFHLVSFIPITKNH